METKSITVPLSSVRADMKTDNPSSCPGINVMKALQQNGWSFEKGTETTVENGEIMLTFTMLLEEQPNG